MRKQIRRECEGLPVIVGTSVHGFSPDFGGPRESEGGCELARRVVAREKQPVREPPVTGVPQGTPRFFPTQEPNMSRTKLVSLVACAVVALNLAACSGGSDQASSGSSSGCSEQGSSGGAKAPSSSGGSSSPPPSETGDLGGESRPLAAAPCNSSSSSTSSSGGSSSSSSSSSSSGGSSSSSGGTPACRTNADCPSGKMCRGDAPLKDGTLLNARCE
jgi:hypothetical protein